MGEALKLLGEMMQGSGKDADGEACGMIMTDMMDKMKGIGGKDPASMEKQLAAVREMLEGLAGAGGLSSDGGLRRESGVDAPDSAHCAAAKQPVHRIETEEGALRLIVEVPGLTSMKDVGLDVSERLASLSFPSETALEALRAELPANVVPTAARAKFSKKTKTLTVTMPLAAAA